MRIRDLFIYPLKSAAGIRLERAALDACGLVDDRRWMLVDADGIFLTQRELPRMALIQARPEPEALVLDAPSMPPLVVERPPAFASGSPLAVARPMASTSARRAGVAPRRMVTVWDDRCEAIDCGDAAAAWVTRFLETDCRLVYFPADGVRGVDQTFGQPDDRVALSDGFPLLLIGQGSLDALNARLEAAGEAPVPMNRFRPNVVIDGAPPHAEDTWRRITADTIPIDIVKPCGRCSIIPVDQRTGIRGIEPLRTLATYRRGDLIGAPKANKVYFGQNLIHRGLGTLAVGAAVEVVARDA